MLTIVFTTFVLTACSSQSDFDVRLSHGDELAIELDGLRMTNQELLEFLTSGNWYEDNMNSGVVAILDWVDSIILPELVEIDESPLIRQEELLLELSASELDAALLVNGFSTLQEALDSHRLRLMRTQVVRNTVVYTDAELYDIFNELFASTDDVDDDEAQTFADIRDTLEDFLVNERISAPGFTESTLARLREEAGMVIYSDYFATHYTNFLNAEFTGELEISTSTSGTVIASVNTTTGVEYFSLDSFFATVITRFAFNDNSGLLNYLDLHVLDGIYNVNRRVINDEITEAKINLLDWFYPQMEFMGLYTEDAIFDWFWLSHMKELAFNEHITLDVDRAQYLLDNYRPARDASHILVEDYAFALELIARLQAAPSNDLHDLFAELAIEYSTCGSAPNGGSLGRLSLPSQMVPEFEDATFSLAEGTFSTTPVESQFGYHIILVDNFDQTPSLATLRVQEMDRLRENPAYIASVMFTLRAEHNMMIHNALLQSRYDSLLAVNRQRTTN